MEAGEIVQRQEGKTGRRGGKKMKNGMVTFN